jgi:hypothetical protein
MERRAADAAKGKVAAAKPQACRRQLSLVSVKLS